VSNFESVKVWVFNRSITCKTIIKWCIRNRVEFPWKTFFVSTAISVVTKAVACDCSFCRCREQSVEHGGDWTSSEGYVTELREECLQQTGKHMISGHQKYQLCVKSFVRLFYIFSHHSFFFSDCTFCKTSACYTTDHSDVMGMGKASM